MPAIDDDAPRRDPGAAANPGPDDARVLVVEDDPAIASSLLALLSDEGHACEFASSGETALERLVAEPVDLVLLDLGLPGIDGIEVLRRLRASGQRTPVLVLSARGGLADRVRALDAGADDFLAKPFELAELGARMRALLRRAASRAQGRIRYAALTIDTEARRAWLAGESFELPWREWCALVFLGAHAGHAVGKRALMAAAGVGGEATSVNAIEVCISRLRARLEPAGLTIRAIRGFGYLLDECR